MITLEVKEKWEGGGAGGLIFPVDRRQAKRSAHPTSLTSRQFFSLTQSHETLMVVILAKGQPYDVAIPRKELAGAGYPAVVTPLSSAVFPPIEMGPPNDLERGGSEQIGLASRLLY